MVVTNFKNLILFLVGNWKNINSKNLNSNDKGNTKSLTLIPKDIKNKKEAYFFIRDLINSPANILGPNEIYHAAKEHLNDGYVCKKITGKNWKKHSR